MKKSIALIETALATYKTAELLSVKTGQPLTHLEKHFGAVLNEALQELNYEEMALSIFRKAISP